MEYLVAVAKPDQTVNRLFTLLGVVVRSIETGRAELALTVTESMLQGAGVFPGGLVATLLDEVMAHAALSLLDEGCGCATIELSTRFFKPVRLGETVLATARVLKRGSRIVFLEAALAVNGDERARAQASFQILPPRP